MKSLLKKIMVAAGITGATISSANAATINITDADLTTGTYNWTKNNVYVLDGLVYLESGGVLNIQEGTVVKFLETPTTDPASSLIIARGAQIFAIGTASEPIIFTSELDDVDNPADLGPTDVKLWAGIVILGKAKTLKDGSYEVNVEGIPTSEPRGLYGAISNDPNNFVDNDNSGTLRYVSIRHTGYGLAAGNELQGLTLGGVGSGTTIEYVESYASSDDGIEIFGGSVNIKYFVSAFIEDDTYDVDEGWSGKGQFWFGIQVANTPNPDAGFEFDGSTPNNTGNATVDVTNTNVYNVTMIGTGKTASVGGTGMVWRAGIKGKLANSLIGDFRGKCLEVNDDSSNTTTDSWSQLIGGNLNFKSNDFFDCGTASDLTGIIKMSSTSNASASVLATHLTNNNNRFANPGLNSLDRDQSSLLDPRPSSSNSSAFTGTLDTYPNDPFFTPVNYRGAFSADAADFWLNGWTALWQNDHLADITVGINDKKVIETKAAIYPNPANGLFTVDFKSNNIDKVELVNISGATIVSYSTIGFGKVEVPTSNLSNGLYIVRLVDVEGNVSVKKVSVNN